MKGLTEEVQTAARTRIDLAYSTGRAIPKPATAVDGVAIRRAAVEVQRERVRRLVESQERSCVWIEEQAGEILKAVGSPVPSRWVNSAMTANRLLDEDEARTIGLVTDRDASALAQHAAIIPWAMEWRKRRSGTPKPVRIEAQSIPVEDPKRKKGRPPPVVSIRVVGEQYRVQIRAKLGHAAARSMTDLLVGLECDLKIGSEDDRTTLRIDARMDHVRLGEIMNCLFPVRRAGIGRQMLTAIGMDRTR